MMVESRKSKVVIVIESPAAARFRVPLRIDHHLPPSDSITITITITSLAPPNERHRFSAQTKSAISGQ